MTDERVGTHEANTRLSEYLNRVCYRGERILIERHGKPAAALVSIEDLNRLEGSSEDVEARYREALEKAGIRVSWTKPGERVPRERRLIKVKGCPVSERIIAEHCYEAHLAAYYLDASAVVKGLRCGARVGEGLAAPRPRPWPRAVREPHRHGRGRRGPFPEGEGRRGGRRGN